MIPLLRPSMTEREVEAVSQVLQSGWIGQGPKCEEFEQALAERYGYRYAITVNSGTAALHLACLANNIGPGDEVIVPALTFISTALAVSYCGAKPVFADVREDSLCMDWDDAAKKRTSKTKAIIPVDYAGYPSLKGRGATWWRDQDYIPLIQDAAHANGSRVYGNEVCFSFHAVKNLATCDGGAILTHDKTKAERMRALRWCGINRSTWERSGKKYTWDYDIQELGYKCHSNDLVAAIGLVQLERLDEMNARRKTIAARYNCHLADYVQIPSWHNGSTNHLYVIRVANSQNRNELIDHLLSKGISAGVHYKPLTYYKPYADQQTPPVTEREWQRLVSLPIFPDMTDDEQAQVIDTVKEFFNG